MSALDALLAAGGEPDDVLRSVVTALVQEGGCRWAGILFREDGDLVLGPSAGEPAPATRVQVPVLYAGTPVADLAADGCDDPLLLDTVAARIGELCLVAWDTAGEPWEP